MTVIDVRTDEQALTLTAENRFDAPVERVWQVWADPRKLEKWWGPPGFPATVVDHDLTPGGRITYYMTGPDGVKYHGYMAVLSVTAPHDLQVEDGFADDTGAPNPAMPTNTTTVRVEADGDGTRMTLVTQYASAEDMATLVGMGMVEGITAALGQVDALVAA